MIPEHPPRMLACPAQAFHVKTTMVFVYIFMAQGSWFSSLTDLMFTPGFSSGDTPVAS